MNFTELKTEFYARGTNYLEEDAAGVTRAELWLNQGYREILNLQPWPFLKATTTGSAGAGFVSIPDLRRVAWVKNAETGFALTRATADELADEDVDLTLPGAPEFYYVNGPEVRAYPLGGTLFVSYYKRMPPLTGTDSPVFDEEYHLLIVDKAMIFAYIDGDNFEAAAALRAELDLRLSAMAEDYLIESREPLFITPSGSDL